MKNRSVGVSGMMKAYHEKKKRSGSWYEDLDRSFVVFETLSRICKHTPNKMIEAIPIMLDGGEFRTVV